MVVLVGGVIRATGIATVRGSASGEQERASRQGREREKGEVDPRKGKSRFHGRHVVVLLQLFHYHCGSATVFIAAEPHKVSFRLFGVAAVSPMPTYYATPREIPHTFGCDQAVPSTSPRRLRSSESVCAVRNAGLNNGAGLGIGRAAAEHKPKQNAADPRNQRVMINPSVIYELGQEGR